MSLDLFYKAVDKLKKSSEPFHLIVNKLYNKHFVDLTGETYGKRSSEFDSHQKRKKRRSVLEESDLTAQDAPERQNDQMLECFKSMFPDVDLKFVEYLQIVAGKTITNQTQLQDHILNVLLTGEYPKIVEEPPDKQVTTPSEGISNSITINVASDTNSNYPVNFNIKIDHNAGPKLNFTCSQSSNVKICEKSETSVVEIQQEDIELEEELLLKPWNKNRKIKAPINVKQADDETNQILSKEAPIEVKQEIIEPNQNWNWEAPIKVKQEVIEPNQNWNREAPTKVKQEVIEQEEELLLTKSSNQNWKSKATVEVPEPLPKIFDNIPRPILELNDHITKHSEEYAAEDDIWSAQFWSDFAKGNELDEIKTAHKLISKNIQLLEEQQNENLIKENNIRKSKPSTENSNIDHYLDYLIHQLEVPSNYTQQVNNTSRNGKEATITSAQASNIVPNIPTIDVKAEMASSNVTNNEAARNKNLLEIPNVYNPIINRPCCKKKIKVEFIKEEIIQPSTSKQIKLETQEDRAEVHITREEEQIWLKLVPMFPDACPDYLKLKCKGKQNTPEGIDEIISNLFQSEIPMRKAEALPAPEKPLDEEEQYMIMVSVLPDADPLYLRSNCHNLINSPDQLRAFIEQAVEHGGYPTKEEYLRKQKLSAQLKDYTTDFNVNKFLELIPNPKEYFKDPKRVISYQIDCNMRYELNVMFRDLFTCLRVTDIGIAIREAERMASSGKPTILGIYETLSKVTSKMKRDRRPSCNTDIWTNLTNIPMVQEIAYVTHMKEIHAKLQENACQKKAKFEQAKIMGLLVTCECCFDDEVLEEDSSTCMKSEHRFCNGCVIKGIEVGLGDGNTQFSCMASCDSEFSLQTLQRVLKPKIFSKLALRKQLDEVKQAGIEDLESCPFCDFATICPPDGKIFKCLNDECMKESCRLCKEPSHIPYRCEEVEKPAEVQARKFIEDKMTEALLRSCWSCGLKFIKADGCNKMSCPKCGKFTCYVCRKPVKNYDHFNGQGGSKTHLCPLYSDTEKLHIDDVRKNALKAKEEMAQTNPNIELKYDPLTGLPEAPEKDRVYKPGPPVEQLQAIPINQPGRAGILIHAGARVVVREGHVHHFHPHINRNHRRH